MPAGRAILDNAMGSYYGSASAMSVTILLIVFTVIWAMALLQHYGPAWMRLDVSQSGRG